MRPGVFPISLRNDTKFQLRLPGKSRPVPLRWTVQASAGPPVSVDPWPRNRYPTIPVGIHLRISQRGLYALKALIHLAERWNEGTVSTREIAEREEIPEKFLEAILLALKNARIVTSRRGREGGYELRRPPAEVVVGDVVRLLDGPLAPFGDAAELTRLVRTEPRHAGLFDLFLDVRNAAASILDNTTLADLLARDRRILAARHEGADSSRETK